MAVVQRLYALPNASSSASHDRLDALLASVRRRLRNLDGPALSDESLVQEVADLVTLCGKKKQVARWIRKDVRFVTYCLFATSPEGKSARSLYPGTDLSTLTKIAERRKSSPQVFALFDRDFLQAKQGQKILRSEFDLAWKRARNGGMLPHEQEIREHKELMDLALAEASQLDELQRSHRELQARVAVLEDALEKSASREASFVADNSWSEVCRITEDLLRGKEVGLSDLLVYLDFRYGDRVEILESAWKSARESDKADFGRTQEVARQTLLLATDAVDCFRQGGTSLGGCLRQMFGNAYADNEGENLSKAGLRRRTFDYRGKPVVMLQHLKIGIGWNKGETFRAHFLFDRETGKVILGHFGKHLDRR